MTYVSFYTDRVETKWKPNKKAVLENTTVNRRIQIHELVLVQRSKTEVELKLRIPHTTIIN